MVSCRRLSHVVFIINVIYVSAQIVPKMDCAIPKFISTLQIHASILLTDATPYPETEIQNALQKNPLAAAFVPPKVIPGVFKVATLNTDPSKPVIFSPRRKLPNPMVLPKTRVNKPIAPVQKPISPVKRPIAPARKSNLPVQKPIDPVRQSIARVQKQIVPAKKPTAPAQKPITPVQKSIAPAQKPIAPVQKSIAPAQKPIAPVKKTIAPVPKPPTSNSNVKTQGTRTVTRQISRSARTNTRISQRRSQESDRRKRAIPLTLPRFFPVCMSKTHFVNVIAYRGKRCFTVIKDSVSVQECGGRCTTVDNKSWKRYYCVPKYAKNSILIYCPSSKSFHVHHVYLPQSCQCKIYQCDWPWNG